jgi:deoxycytidine triphosphate deaminase
MILSDREIRAAIKQRHIVIDPRPADEQYNTSATSCWS